MNATVSPSCTAAAAVEHKKHSFTWRSTQGARAANKMMEISRMSASVHLSSFRRACFQMLCLANKRARIITFITSRH